MPCLRASSATFTPASASRRIELIFSSLNRDFFIRVLRGENSTPKRSSESGGYTIDAGISHSARVVETLVADNQHRPRIRRATARMFGGGGGLVRIPKWGIRPS